MYIVFESDYTKLRVKLGLNVLLDKVLQTEPLTH